MTSSLALIQQLYLHFGPRDSARVVAIKLDRLQMQNNQQVSKYVVVFNAVAAKTSFGDATLLHWLAIGD